MPGPYRLISTDDPDRTLGEAVDAGDVRYYPTLIEAANAFAESEATFKTVVFDDGHQARKLTDDDKRLCDEQPPRNVPGLPRSQDGSGEPRTERGT